MEKDQKLYNIRHSLAHILASAVLEIFPQARCGVGPVIENGFYYDFLLPRPLNPEDLVKIEKRMRTLVQQKIPFEKQEMTIQQAKEFFKERGQTFKVELINDIEKYGTTKEDEILNQESDPSLYPSLASISSRSGPQKEREEVRVEKVSLYKSGKFIDLCRGPHVDNTSRIRPDAFKLNKVSGAYWRGDQSKQQLQRIYGIAFETKEELDKYLEFLKEVEKRDHKILGLKLELFMFHPTAPGMPYWLPKGMVVLNQLIDFWRQEHQKRGYLEIAAPLVNKKDLWITSGHWEHYREDMFIANMGKEEVYGIKSMNCPNAMIVFGSKSHSYRDLPLRLADTDQLHRYELAGTLNGLFRVRSFRQDDSHNFITEEQIESEYEEILDIAKRFYGIFKLDYRLRLGTRPKKFMGDIATWNRAEDILKRILKNSNKQFNIAEGDGAFYGPKVDILMKDVLGREWQMGTIQLDFHQPRRFGLEYAAKDGSRKTPVVIHRVIYGSLERFIGILIEHYAGAFPLWLSPVQVAVLPISSKQNRYAKQVEKELRMKDEGLRIMLDDRDESIGKKIRDASMQKVPYMVIVGEKEAKSAKSPKGHFGGPATMPAKRALGWKISVRTRAGRDLGQMALKKLAEKIKTEVERKR